MQFTLSFPPRQFSKLSHFRMYHVHLLNDCKYLITLPGIQMTWMKRNSQCVYNETENKQRFHSHWDPIHMTQCRAVSAQGTGSHCSPTPMGSKTKMADFYGVLFKNESSEDFLIHIHYPLTCSQWISQWELKLIAFSQPAWKIIVQWFTENHLYCRGHLK